MSRKRRSGEQVVHGLHGLEAVAALAHDLDARPRGEVLAQQRPRGLLVVHDQHAQRAGRAPASGVRGGAADGAGRAPRVGPAEPAARLAQVGQARSAAAA